MSLVHAAGTGTGSLILKITLLTTAKVVAMEEATMMSVDSV